MALQDTRSDDELMLCYASGDGGAFDILYSRHRLAVYSFLKGMRPSSAEDLCQEAWLRLVKASASWKAGGNFKAYLWRTARNLAIDDMRKKTPELTVDVQSDDGGRTAEIVPEAFVAAPHENLVRREELAAVRAAVAALSPADREVVLLRTQAEMSFAEIASATGAPLGTVLSRMHRALAALRIKAAGILSEKGG
ncbi:MAG: sigma-70 family RNA polymerase sigma factor [Kiritimatiellae bacterium]|nr:sigma-70 family RNA polymerase sigma factor [Kiritimatiellia bacterium]